MHLREVGLTVLGLIATITPLALWLAWSEPVFIFVLGSGIAAVTAIWVLAGFEESLKDDERDGASHGPAQTLSDESLSELSELGPFVYHHCSTGGPRFQTTMRALKSRLRIT